jgi:ABC-type branched-subunit amino acid transport system substrate-binding protein
MLLGRSLALLLAALGGVTASAQPDATTPGVTSTSIKVGERSAFSGPSEGLGVELWRGASAAFQEANEAGGVFGRHIDYVIADDAYDADKAELATTQLVERDRAFVLFGGVGTPTIARALPVVLKHFASDGLVYFANFTGAQLQREPPYDKVVFNIRASYREETKAMVDAFVAVGRKRIGVFIQDDAYGASGRDGVERALAGRRLKIAATTRYPRGQTYETSTAVQVKALRAAGVQAIVAVGAYQACAALIRDARKAGLTVPIHNVSFVGADQMLELLADEPNAAQLMRNIVVTQVVPAPSDTALPVVREYRAAMDRFNPVVPRGMTELTYRPRSPYSFGSLEGYLNAKALLAVLTKAGQDLSRKSFLDAAESMGRFDLGVGVTAELSPTRHQALDKVWFTYPTAEGWKVTEDPTKLIK